MLRLHLAAHLPISQPVPAVPVPSPLGTAPSLGSGPRSDPFLLRMAACSVPPAGCPRAPSRPRLSSRTARCWGRGRAVPHAAGMVFLASGFPGSISPCLAVRLQRRALGQSSSPWSAARMGARCCWACPGATSHPPGGFPVPGPPFHHPLGVAAPQHPAGDTRGVTPDPFVTLGALQPGTKPPGTLSPWGFGVSTHLSPPGWQGHLISLWLCLLIGKGRSRPCDFQTPMNEPAAILANTSLPWTRACPSPAPCLSFPAVRREQRSSGPRFGVAAGRRCWWPCRTGLEL